jgi:hypothetical protein
MQFECLCGTMLSDTASPNDTEHLLISSRSIERLQDLVDDELAKDGVVDMWPEHWDECGAIEVWKCHKCNRLYVQPRESPEKIIVYSIEKIGL